MMEGECDRAVRLVNASGAYPGWRAFRASRSGPSFLVLLRHVETGEVRQIEWREP